LKNKQLFLKIVFIFLSLAIKKQIICGIPPFFHVEEEKTDRNLFLFLTDSYLTFVWTEGYLL